MRGGYGRTAQTGQECCGAIAAGAVWNGMKEGCSADAGTVGTRKPAHRMAKCLKLRPFWTGIPANVTCTPREGMFAGTCDVHAGSERAHRGTARVRRPRIPYKSRANRDLFPTPKPGCTLPTGFRPGAISCSALSQFASHSCAKRSSPARRLPAGKTSHGAKNRSLRTDRF